MARVARMKHEGWPSWAKLFFMLCAIALIVTGIFQIIISTHGQAVMGVISIVIGALFLWFWTINPRWRVDPVDR